MLSKLFYKIGDFFIRLAKSKDKNFQDFVKERTIDDLSRFDMKDFNNG